MKINEVIGCLENIAPPSLQESYDNCGLLTGSDSWECSGIIVSLDATEAVVEEAIAKGCNLIVAHHPIIFSGLKKITGKNYVERTVIAAIKNDIAIYAIHTNLDNVLHGVNGRIADKLGLKNRRILSAKKETLKKLFTYVPVEHLDKVRDAVFAAGGGMIGNYSECSFAGEGTGSFKANEGMDPFVGDVGQRHYEKEAKLEIVFEAWKEKQILNALIRNHPYEEVAYDIISLDNVYQQTGSGLIGELEAETDEIFFLDNIKKAFGLKIIRHTALSGKKIKKVAICGGAGSFLINAAIAAGADLYVTSDIKYHDFFEADNRVVLADIGHYESEQFTIDLLAEFLENKFPTFAVLKTGVKTNPVEYY
ncbi:MAG: Nif3-like dinuclear metal center hexameric protein [Ferruginibacter sp.]